MTRSPCLLSDDVVAYLESDATSPECPAVRFDDAADITQLLLELGPFLTAKSGDRRRRAYDIVSKFDVDAIPATVHDHLVRFLCERLASDPSSASSITSCLLPLLNTVPESLARAMIPFLLRVDVRSLSQGNRGSVFSIISRLLSDHRLLVDDPTLISGYLALAEGEKDPRNLVSVFETERRLLSSPSLNDDLAEDMFEAASCYFPITYRAQTSADVPEQVLCDLLLDCLTGDARLAQHSVPFFLDKLHSTSTSAQVAALGALSTSFDRFPLCGATSAHLPELADSLIQLLASSSSSNELVEAGLSTLKSVTKRLCSTDVVECDERFMAPMLETIADECFAIDSRNGRTFSRAFTTMCAASPSALRRCCTSSPLVDRVLDQVSAGTAGFSQTLAMIDLLNGVVAAYLEFDVHDPVLLDRIFNALRGASCPDLAAGVVASAASCLARLAPALPLPSLERLLDFVDPILSANVADDVVDAYTECLARAAERIPEVVLSRVGPGGLDRPRLLSRLGAVDAFLRCAIRPCLAPAVQQRLHDDSELIATLARAMATASSATILEAVDCIAMRLAPGDAYSNDIVDLFQAIASRAPVDVQTDLCKVHVDDFIVSRRVTALLGACLHSCRVIPDPDRLLAGLLEDSSDHPDLVGAVVNNTDRTVDDVNARDDLTRVWVAKALAMRGCPTGIAQCRDLVRERCAHFPVVFQVDPKWHWRVLPLYKQRVLHAVLPIFLEQLEAGDDVSAVLAAVLEQVPRPVILENTAALLPVLLRAFTKKDATVALLASTFATISVLIASDVSCIASDFSAVIGPLLRLAAASSRDARASVRVAALETLIEFATLPHHVTYPFASDIRAALMKAMDDPKRVVRQAARRARQVWTVQ